MSKVLVTGANGFVGAAVLARLLDDKREVVGAVRRPTDRNPHWLQGPALGPQADWRPLLEHTAVVVHTAARVHQMNEDQASARTAHTHTNAQGTIALARQAAEAGVKRFIFLSTIKVMGEKTQRPFRANDTPAPSDAYSESKLEAERGLEEIGRRTGMEWVTIRPPLVYGPSVGGNFATLMQWVARGLPLPLGAIHNRRSLVARDNLVDLIATCVDHPAAANRTLLVSDDEDLSTTELICRLSAAMGIRPRLIPVPAPILEGVGRLLGKRAMIERLCCDLQVDIEDTKRSLNWRPPLSVDAGLLRAAGTQ